MNSRTQRPLLLATIAVLAAAIGVPLVLKPVSDNDALQSLKQSTQKIPNMAYPAKDLRGRSIPNFDCLIVYPDCNSCSDFRLKSIEYMDSRPETSFLILTPDTKGIDTILKQNRYFVALVAKKSKLSELLPGIYNR